MENEKLNKTREEMIKKAKKIGECFEMLVGLVIIIIVLGSILGTINGIVMWSEGATFMEIVNDTGDILSVKMDISTIGGIIEIIVKAITTILSIVAVMALSKVFKNTAKDGTPFSLSNTKNMKKISRCAVIIFFATFFSPTQSIGAVYPLAICGMEYIFRYGYKLQLESDETL